MTTARPGGTTRPDLAPLGHEPAKGAEVLVVHHFDVFFAEEAVLAPPVAGGGPDVRLGCFLGFPTVSVPPIRFAREDDYLERYVVAPEIDVLENRPARLRRPPAACLPRATGSRVSFWPPMNITVSAMISTLLRLVPS